MSDPHPDLEREARETLEPDDIVMLSMADGSRVVLTEPELRSNGYVPLSQLQTERAVLAAAEQRIEELRTDLARAAFIAEHLHQMVTKEQWRATGGDDMQGHYEGDYRAEQVADEIQQLAARAALDKSAERER